MQLVEAGLIDLETDINEYLDFDIPNELYGHGSSTPPEPITISHLLTQQVLKMLQKIFSSFPRKGCLPWNSG